MSADSVALVLDRVIDGSLAVALPFLAWRVLVTNDLPKAVVLFIAFGLLSSVTWARLGAPDVALVEAAVGAGLTGALLMGALGWIEAPRRSSPPLALRAALALAMTLLVMLLALVVLALPEQSTGLGPEVDAALARSGASHPVTAVLLNFRGYDTFLEVVVLLVAGLGAHTWGRRVAVHDETIAKNPLLPVLVRKLIPVIVLVAGYLWWRGSHGPGGAFQAGALLGGGAILLLLAEVIPPPSLAKGLVRAGLVWGPLVFVIVAVAPLLTGAGALLEYPAAWASTLIVAIEAALTISIALVLTLFFPAATEAAGKPPRSLPSSSASPAATLIAPAESP